MALCPRIAHITSFRRPPLRSASVSRAYSVNPKEELLDLCGHASDNGVTAPEELRARIKEAARALEKWNTVEKPADEGKWLLDGKWALEYTTTKAASSGKLGPFIGEVTQEVDVINEFYINNVSFGPLRISLTACWDVLDDVKWKVYFKDMFVTIFGAELYRKPLPSRGGYWKMTYVDENLRLIRTITDRREPSVSPSGMEIQDVLKHVEENLFVLTRIPR